MQLGRKIENETALEFIEMPLVDLPTLLLFLLMTCGQIFLAWSYSALGTNPLLVAVLATALMNLSFTIWHECSHRNFSRIAGFSDLIGAIASFMALGPAYFHRRNEHIIHHRFEGNPEKDPVYPRIQTRLLDFPLHLLRLRKSGQNRVLFTELLPLSPREKAADLALSLLTLALVLAFLIAGLWQELLLVWIFPRIAITFLHAYYICFLPHHRPEGGFTRFRVRPGILGQLLTVNQNLHGVHHMFPLRPWHHYPKMLGAIRASARTQELEVK